MTSQSADTVVFRGDGEPRTAADTLRQLAELDPADVEADVYSLGGSVERLERRFAEMLGKESAIFMPTGTLANHLALRRLCGTRPKAIVQEQSHLFHDTGDSVARLSGITLLPLANGRPWFTVDELRAALDLSDTERVASPVGAVMVESPVRRCAGQIVPFDQMDAITSLCRERGVATHLDGARLYMMSAATGIVPQTYAALYDTVYVSLYKYFGAPFGAVLAGPSGLIDGLYHDRRMFGGGLSSAYLATELAMLGAEGFEERFAAAMRQADELFDALDELPGLEVQRFEHGSNIVLLHPDEEVSMEPLVDSLRDASVLVYPDDDDASAIRLTVNTTILRRSNADLVDAFRAAIAAARERV